MVIFLKCTFLTQATLSLGGTDPIVIPTPNYTIEFSTRMFSAQVAIVLAPLAGLTATASS